MSTELKYTITSFDEEHKIIRVSYDDGSWAEIQLAAPFPANEQELDMVVKQFARPVEAMQAKVMRVDLSFIAQLVGAERSTLRRSMLQQERAPTPQEREMANAAAALSEAAEEARILALVEKVLIERGLA